MNMPCTKTIVDATMRPSLSCEPTSARMPPVKAQPAAVSRSWQARIVRPTAAGSSADGLGGE
jgi:hypothetical protein